MPRGSKNKYSDKQKRQADHIEEGYEKKGLSEDQAERIAYSTVNKIYGGGEKGGSGSSKHQNKESYKRGGHKGGKH